MEISYAVLKSISHYFRFNPLCLALKQTLDKRIYVNYLKYTKNPNKNISEFWENSVFIMKRITTLT